MLDQFTPCSIEGCTKKVRARGWCPTHWARWRKNGSPHIVLRAVLVGTPEERFWARVNRDGPLPSFRPDLGPCWISDRAGCKGYSYFSVKCKRMLAHHFLVGKPSKGLEWDHLCRVRACVRPSHLELVTTRENGRRGIKGVLTTHCPHGHLYNETNTYYGPTRGERRCRQCARERARRT